jgi:hypothetical protein
MSTKRVAHRPFDLVGKVVPRWLCSSPQLIWDMPCEESAESTPLQVGEESAAPKCRSYDTFPAPSSDGNGITPLMRWQDDRSHRSCTDCARSFFYFRSSYSATFRKWYARARVRSPPFRHLLSVSFWTAVFVLLVLVVPLPFSSVDVRNGSTVEYNEVSYSFPFHRLVEESEWHWDHNVYQSREQEEWLDPERRPSPEPMDVPSNTEVPIPQQSPMGRNLLIAQFVGGVDQSSRRRKRKASALERQRVLSNVADVTSRPNRAYARQWGRNFVRFQLWDDLTIALSLFLKVIRDRQEEQAALEYKDECILPYDAIAFLLPGAVIMDLDYDLLELIPKDKLLAIGGKGARQRTSNVTETYSNGIILLNLQHDRANQLIDQWWNELESSYMQQYSDRTANSDDSMQILIQMTASMLFDGEDLTSLVFYLEETDLGFVLEAPYSIADTEKDPYSDVSPNSFCIKSFLSAATDDSRLRNSEAASAIPLLADPQSTMVTLQTTADAVCYRYYPKCELL